MNDDCYIRIAQVGKELRRELLGNQEVTKRVDNRIIPIATPVNMRLPFMTFFRADTTAVSVKGCAGPMTSMYQIQVYTEDHDQGLDIALEILRTLDGYQSEDVRICKMSNWQENYEAEVPAFVQILLFEVRIR